MLCSLVDILRFYLQNVKFWLSFVFPIGASTGACICTAACALTCGYQCVKKCGTIRHWETVYQYLLVT